MNGYGGHASNIEARKSAGNNGPIDLQGSGNSYSVFGGAAANLSV
jgi:hypothetical protein